MSMHSIEIDSFITKEILGADLTSQYGRLLNQCFPVPAGHQFFVDFPVWNPVLAVSQVKRIGIYDDGRLVSCAGGRLAHFKNFREGPYPVALIGGVATDPAYAKRGLASRAVKEVVDWAEKNGAQMILLWSSELRMYERLGFATHGTQQHLLLDLIPELSVSSKLSQNQLPVHLGWNPHLFDLRQKDPRGLVLNNSDRTWFSVHKNVQWFYLGAPDQPTAYAAVGRGIDLSHIVHEWGPAPAESPAIRGLLHYIKEAKWATSILGSAKRFAELGIASQSAPTEPLCLARWVDRTQIGPEDFWLWGLDAA